MKLKKAIEIATLRYRVYPYKIDPDFENAISLLIEAGKREITNRENPDYVIVGKLPGETED